MQDLRSALRHLRRSPAFTAAALLTFALGIGANLATFNLLYALVLRPVSLPDPNRLVSITGVNRLGQVRGAPIGMVDALSRQSALFEATCGYAGGGIYAVEANGAPWQTLVEVVTGGCGAALGAQPLLGRFIGESDAPATGDGPPVVVIGHGFWQRAFGGDPGVLGRGISIEGIQMTVIGVMPPGYTGLQVETAPDVIFAYGRVSPSGPRRPVTVNYVVARLSEGAAITRARTEVSARWHALVAEAAPPTLTAVERQALDSLLPDVQPAGRGFSMLRLQYGAALRSIVAFSALLLLLACINIGALQLSRLSARSGELAVRAALGASRRRLVQQVTIEGLVLALGGSACAVPLAWWSGPAIAALASTGRLLPLTLSLKPDGHVLVAVAVTALACGAIAVTLPAWMAGRRDVQLAARWQRTIATSTTRWGRGLLAVQIALSLVLLTAAALLTASLAQLRAAEPGYRTAGLLLAKLMPWPGAYRDMDHASYYPALLDRLAALPGVTSVGMSRLFPRYIGEAFGLQPVAAAEIPAGQEQVGAVLEVASPDFFRTAGIPLLKGRAPSWRDDVDTSPVALLNETLAEQLFPGIDPLGRRVRLGTDSKRRALEIIGVVGDASLGNPRSPRVPVVYRPSLQEPGYAQYPAIQIRAAGNPLTLADEARRVVASLGREYVHEVTTVDEQRELALGRDRLVAALAAAAAALAVLLVSVGIYSLLAHAVARRTREIGVRMAVGADRARVVLMVIRESLVVVAGGLAVGVPLALVAGQLMQSLLFGVSPSDPLTLAAAAAFLVALGGLAALIPACRAASVDPTVALRAE